MRELSLKYYREGFNCSQCVLKAAEDYYGVNVPEECYTMCSGVGNGFGIGEFCCALIGATMVFGLLFDEKTAKRLRIKYLYEFSLTHKNLSCCRIKREKVAKEGCEKLITDSAGLVARLVREENADIEK